MTEIPTIEHKQHIHLYNNVIRKAKRRHFEIPNKKNNELIKKTQYPFLTTVNWLEANVFDKKILIGVPQSYVK